jgi:ZIP family zinc transporter
VVHALLFTLIPVAAAMTAGLIAAAYRPGEKITSAVQHFAAGVVFAAAAIELLPKVLAESPSVAIGGFAAGIAVMFGMRAFTDRLESRQGDGRRGSGGGWSRLPLGFAGATAIDFAIDGVILGAGFAAGGPTGLLLTLALTVEYLFVGLSLSATLGPDASRRLVIAAPVALSLLTVLGTALGVWLLSGASPTTLAAVLAFGAVAFMYLATEELLVEAHQRGETAAGSVTFFVGFLLYMVLSETLS